MILGVTRKSHFLEGWEFFESEVDGRLRSGKHILPKAVVRGPGGEA